MKGKRKMEGVVKLRMSQLSAAALGPITEGKIAHPPVFWRITGPSTKAWVRQGGLWTYARLSGPWHREVSLQNGAQETGTKMLISGYYYCYGNKLSFSEKVKIKRKTLRALHIFSLLVKCTYLYI